MEPSFPPSIKYVQPVLASELHHAWYAAEEVPDSDMEPSRAAGLKAVERQLVDFLRVGNSCADVPWVSSSAPGA